MKEKIVRKGDIFYADLSPVIGSEQGGIRPIVVLQNDVGNRFSKTTKDFNFVEDYFEIKDFKKEVILHIMNSLTKER